MKNKNIVWDLGGVLLKENIFKILLNINIVNVIIYTILSLIAFKNPFKLKQKLFYILSKYKIDKKKLIECRSSSFPPIIILWLKGEIKNNIIIHNLNELVNNYYNNKRKSIRLKIEKNLILKLIKTVFSPKILSYCIDPIEKSISILEECYNNGNNMYILSNWDSKTFELIYHMDKNKNIFKYFDYNNIIISANVKKVKPCKNLYTYFINKFNLEKDNTIFIDNDLQNIETIKQLGFKYIYLQKENFKQLKEDLVRNEFIKIFKKFNK